MKTAIITIHGVSNHLRYQHLESFCRGLKKGLGQRRGTWISKVLEPRIEPDAPTSALRDAYVRFESAYSQIDQQNDTIDVFEAYWSPRGKHKVNFFTLLRSISRYNRSGFTRVFRNDEKNKSDLLIAILAIGFLIIVVSLPLVISSCFAKTSSTPFIAMPLITAVALLFSSILIDLCRIIRRIIVNVRATWLAQKKSSCETRVSSLLNVLFFGNASSHLVGAILIGYIAFRAGLMTAIILIYLHFVPLYESGNSQMMLSLIACIIVYPIFFYIFDFFYIKAFPILSDLLTYGSIDDNQVLAEERRALVNKVTDLIRFQVQLRNLDDGRVMYDQVVIFGHSLGAIIAFESINNFYRYSIQSRTEADFRRLKGLVTYGSGLEKVEEILYESAAKAGDINAVMRSYQNIIFHNIAKTSGGTVLWLNYWYKYDLVAGTMKAFESLCTSEKLNSKWSDVPVAHGRYHTDDDFWANLLSKIL